jgi:hypothetical protein
MSKLKVSTVKKVLDRNQKMTAERLRNFKGFEKFSNQEAKEVIKKLEHLAAIVCKHVQNSK